MKKLKWIIAREVLILIALGVVLHLLLSLLQNVAIVLPQYRSLLGVNFLYQLAMAYLAWFVVRFAIWITGAVRDK
ncbi:MAG: hypothetical protein ACOY3D_07040 [Candidatus Omnitrophota bacterium]